jgi:hypothetical protein
VRRIPSAIRSPYLSINVLGGGFIHTCLPGTAVGVHLDRYVCQPFGQRFDKDVGKVAMVGRVQGWEHMVEDRHPALADDGHTDRVVCLAQPVPQNDSAMGAGIRLCQGNLEKLDQGAACF